MKQLLKKNRSLARPPLLVSLVIGTGLIALGTYGIAVAKRSSIKTSHTQLAVMSTTDIPTQGLRFMPGTSQEKGGLRIQDQDFRIVEQDGSGGQANPPLALSGSRLDVKGDFNISATMQDIKGDASFRLYGKVPVIQDEFRVESPSIEVSVNNNQLTLRMWDGSESENPDISAPTLQKTYPRVSSNTADITIQHIGNNVLVMDNDTTVATVGDMGIFRSGTVWFGANSTNGDYLLSNLQTQALNSGSTKVVDTAYLKVYPAPGTQYLQKLASQKRPDFLVGAAMALGPAVSDSQYRQVAFGGNFGSMTTENALKWQFVHPKKDVYDFHEADRLVDFAKRHDMSVHGHTLVFGEANPKWLEQMPRATDADKQAIREVMTKHINTVLAHYKGQMASWDVINEPIADYDDFDLDAGKTLRNNIWMQALGEDYIAEAFRTAHQADPQTKLYINEYGLESKGERWDTFLALVTKLKTAGVPIDGVGFQAHIYEAGDKINTTVLKAHMQQLAKLGLESRISEMDAYDDDGTATQAKQYQNVFAACISEPSCKSWTTWGVSDRYDMFKDEGVVNYGHDFLWDDKMRPTKALTGILTSLTQP